MNKRIFFFLISLLSFSLASAQELTIEFGRNNIALNQAFTITLTAHNTRMSRYSGFPDIEGFVKRGTSSSSSTNFINGQRSSSVSITQNYAPTKEGQFKLPPFKIQVDDKVVSSNGTVITVGPAVKRQQQRQRYDPFADPFDDFFGRSNQPQEFIEVEADAFLALTSDKPSVYVGEGFTMTLAFYVSEKNQAELSFYELNAQLGEIIKKIKPANCWEENFEIENIQGEPVTINGEAFKQYRVFQSAFYPLNTDPIILPKVDMKMIKYKVAKNRTFFGRNRKEEIVTFSSKEKKVTVKDLPDHPLKESVSVGNYRLDEKISKSQLETGNSFTYSFAVVGEGNISAIKDLEVVSDDNFDLYPPNIRQDISRSNGHVRGGKSFSFYGVPNEPGEFDMSEYFQWVYFNPKKETYDTLKSEVKLIVSGESKKNEHILSNDMGSFYDVIEEQDNRLFSIGERERLRTILNIVIFALIAGVIALMIKK
ncbi:BatD family protein [Reichenbachiella versicolor]|uniref:BatD family protein n=1 Tax=Reichenbachiella versicolor TaxID=1821036 RepID=UPI000D6DD610|nr:BatD family protein [Reichenbachiella versicolor]